MYLDFRFCKTTFSFLGKKEREKGREKEREREYERQSMRESILERDSAIYIYIYI
jgi:hypothetical protein